MPAAKLIAGPDSTPASHLASQTDILRGPGDDLAQYCALSGLANVLLSFGLNQKAPSSGQQPAADVVFNLLVDIVVYPASLAKIIMIVGFVVTQC